MEPGDLPQKSDLPHRAGARPRTRVGLPHVQLDQWPPAEIAERLVALAVNIPGIRAKQSRMAAASSLALCVCDEFAHGPPEAFIDNHEFCLLHSLPQGSIHLTLPYEIREKAIRSGWAEQHPGTKAGIMPSTLVMVYAPRDAEELRVVFDLISASLRFAKGQGGAERRAAGGGEHERRHSGVMTWVG